MSTAAAAAPISGARPTSSSPSPSHSSPSTVAPPTRSAASSSDPAKPPVNLTLDKTTLLSDKAHLSGTITLGPSTVVHPTARLVAPPTSSITLGAHCLVEDGVLIEARPGEALSIGNWNFLECGATVRASMGHANWLRVRAELRPTGRIGRGVEVGVAQRVTAAVADGSTILFDGSERRCEDSGVTSKEREKRIMETLLLHINLAREALTKYNKPTVK